MELKDIQEKKKEAERLIAQILRGFENETGLEVANIEMYKQCTSSFPETVELYTSIKVYL